ncbi:MAG: LCP family protein [Anaerolineales bacterium]|nr:LCP family protein [Anaerolineales bacterium]
MLHQNNPSPALPSSTEMQMPVWDGSSRINIVFFGLRSQDLSSPDCPLCTDTIIVLTVDPLTKTAGMLSIPRDMWVNIPGYGYSRINTAWAIGEADKVPGGGAQLALQTISQFLGVPLHYYAQVDFGTFVSFINLIGGIDVYVEERMVLDPAGPGQDHFVLKPGDYRHLNGKRALAYARCRDESKGCRGGDFGRAARQQQVIMAIRDKVFDPTYFPTLLTQAPQIYITFASGIQTNFSFEDALKLAILVQEIPTEKIQQRVIDPSMAIPTQASIQGIPANVLRPVPDLIRILRDELFNSSSALRPLAQENNLTLMQVEQARIRVINHTYVPEFEKRVASYLTSQGMQVVEYGIPTSLSTHTTIIVYSEKLYTLRYLTEMFGITSRYIIIRPAINESVDIEIQIGEDWINKLPTGY